MASRVAPNPTSIMSCSDVTISKSDVHGSEPHLPPPHTHYECLLHISLCLNSAQVFSWHMIDLQVNSSIKPRIFPVYLWYPPTNLCPVQTQCYVCHILMAIGVGGWGGIASTFPCNPATYVLLTYHYTWTKIVWSRQVEPFSYLGQEGGMELKFLVFLESSLNIRYRQLPLGSCIDVSLHSLHIFCKDFCLGASHYKYASWKSFVLTQRQYDEGEPRQSGPCQSPRDRQHTVGHRGSTHHPKSQSAHKRHQEHGLTAKPVVS